MITDMHPHVAMVLDCLLLHRHLRGNCSSTLKHPNMLTMSNSITGFQQLSWIKWVACTRGRCNQPYAMGVATHITMDFILHVLFKVSFSSFSTAQSGLTSSSILIAVLAVAELLVHRFPPFQPGVELKVHGHYWRWQLLLGLRLFGLLPLLLRLCSRASEFKLRIILSPLFDCHQKA